MCGAELVKQPDTLRSLSSKKNAREFERLVALAESELKKKVTEEFADLERDAVAKLHEQYEAMLAGLDSENEHRMRDADAKPPAPGYVKTGTYSLSWDQVSGLSRGEAKARWASHNREHLAAEYSRRVRETQAIIKRGRARAMRKAHTQAVALARRALEESKPEGYVVDDGKLAAKGKDRGFTKLDTMKRSTFVDSTDDVERAERDARLDAQDAGDSIGDWYG